ncbi:BCCT family transporter [Aquisalimonas sp. 2447]|uniref:BCCT family transporter n=1 Tax=Aquisalimonas sp. 2447 TaxID=2740807 RepID=UPI0014324984|nr:BCCT family transporter [Aquisalimonas sp. 2447]QIT56059.1 BCCT family transporter [Aquisalimonas sp. 2447]
MSETTTAAAPAVARPGLGDPWVLGLSGGFIVAFLVFSLIDLAQVQELVDTGHALAAEYLGSFWQLLLLATFFTAIGVAVSPAGSAVMGDLDRPEMSTFRWVSIIMCTLLAGGGVFFAAGEPLYHFLETPPVFGVESATHDAVAPALAQSFMHWGFLAWAILGALTSIVLMQAHYRYGKPLQPRTLLYPVFGERVMRNPWGGIVDAVCVIAVVAGTVGPIGFLATQVSFGANTLFGLPEGFATQFGVLIVLALIYVTSAVTGIHRGIQVLSRFNVFLALGIGAFIFVFGPTLFLVNSYLQGFGTYLNDFLPMATVTSETAPDWWMQWWTVFFFAWFLGYGPLMAMFIARISRGRTIRQMIIALAVAAPIASTIWFTLLGGAGIHYQLTGAIDLAEPLADFQFDVATLTVAQALPLGGLMAVLILVLTTIFVATTGDSMSYTISMVATGDQEPHTAVRAFWGVAMAVTAGVLLFMGEGGISALQQFIVVTAVPVSLILLPSLYTGPKMAYAMAREQGIVR